MDELRRARSMSRLNLEIELQKKHVCTYCNEVVYPAERLAYDGKMRHKQCFRCDNCDTRLTLSTQFSFAGKVYCKTCNAKLINKFSGKLQHVHPSKSSRLALNSVYSRCPDSNGSPDSKSIKTKINSSVVSDESGESSVSISDDQGMHSFEEVSEALVADQNCQNDESCKYSVDCDCANIDMPGDEVTRSIERGSSEEEETSSSPVPPTEVEGTSGVVLKTVHFQDDETERKEQDCNTVETQTSPQIAPTGDPVVHDNTMDGDQDQVKKESSFTVAGTLSTDGNPTQPGSVRPSGPEQVEVQDLENKPTTSRVVDKCNELESRRQGRVFSPPLPTGIIPQARSKSLGRFREKGDGARRSGDPQFFENRSRSKSTGRVREHQNDHHSRTYSASYDRHPYAVSHGRGFNNFEPHFRSGYAINMPTRQSTPGLRSVHEVQKYLSRSQ